MDTDRSAGQPRAEPRLHLLADDRRLENADTEFSLPVAEERFDLLESDVVLVVLQGPESEARLRSRPTWQALRAVQDDRVVYLPVDPYGYAMSFGTVLSVPFATGEVARRLAEAVARVRP